MQYECSVKYVEYSGTQSFQVEVKKACIQYDTKVCAVARVYSIILEALSCTFHPDHQY